MKTLVCFDCNVANEEGSHWGDDNWRCKSCSDVRREKVRQERAERDARATCDECGDKTGCWGNDTCEECCDHSDTDHHCCLICGKDMMEDFCARAEAMAEGER